MGMDSVEELSGYDDVDADQIFNGGRIEGGRGRGEKTPPLVHQYEG